MPQTDLSEQHQGGGGALHRGPAPAGHGSPRSTHPRLQLPTLYTIVPGAHYRERSLSRNAGLFAAKLMAERVCHYKRGEYETAIQHFAKTVELNPASATDYANLGVNYRKLDKYEEAVKHFQLALSLDPSIDFARSHLEELPAGC